MGIVLCLCVCGGGGRFPGGSMGKESTYNVGDSRDVGSIPGPETPPGGGHEWQPTPVFLPRESHGQRSLSGNSPQGHKELNMTEVTEYTHRHIHTYFIVLKCLCLSVLILRYYAMY